MKTVSAGLAIFLGFAAAALSTAHADPVKEMLAADAAFAKMAQDESVPAAFAHYAADDVWMFPEGGEAYQGRNKLIERFAGWPDGATLEWFPQHGMSASSGDFGFTWGRYVFTSNADGETSVSHGKYVSIWRKENDDWKFVADIGNSGPAPENP